MEGYFSLWYINYEIKSKEVLIVENTLFLISVGVLFIGFISLCIGSSIFKWRAFTNKPAWNGGTIPFIVLGSMFSILGILLVYVFYPFK